MATALGAEDCTGAPTWIQSASKESQSDAQRINRIIDFARRDAATSDNLSVWSTSLTPLGLAGGSVIEARRLQRSFGDGLIAAEIKDLRESWMQHADVVLQDDAIISAVHQALAHRHPNSRSHGRPGFPAEVVLRLLILSTCAIGVTRFWSVKSVPIWCTATSPASAPTRCPMPRPWAAGGSRSDRR